MFFDPTEEGPSTWTHLPSYDEYDDDELEEYFENERFLQEKREEWEDEQALKRTIAKDKKEKEKRRKREEFAKLTAYSMKR